MICQDLTFYLRLWSPPWVRRWHLVKWCAYVCMPTACSILHAGNSASQYARAGLHVYVLAWREWSQGAGALSVGPACPQSLTICALLVVIKVSNLEVSWGLAKRGQKMSLHRSSWWAAAAVFTYLYTLIAFALLPWHWGNHDFVVEKKKKWGEYVNAPSKKIWLWTWFK